MPKPSRWFEHHAPFGSQMASQIAAHTGFFILSPSRISHKLGLGFHQLPREGDGVASSLLGSDLAPASTAGRVGQSLVVFLRLHLLLLLDYGPRLLG
jgi:hypothetical protein